MTRYHVTIATTRGPSAIRSVAPERIGKQSTLLMFEQAIKELALSSDFKPLKTSFDELLDAEFGIAVEPGPIRVKVTRDITDGESFQLGALAMQALYYQKRLAFDIDESDHVLIVSGIVLTDSLRTKDIDSLEFKIPASCKLVNEAVEAGKKVTFVLPSKNKRHVDAYFAGGEVPEAAKLIDFVYFDKLQELLNWLGIDCEKNENNRISAGTNLVRSEQPPPLPEDNPNPGSDHEKKQTPTAKQRRGWLVPTMAVFLIGGAASAGYVTYPSWSDKIDIARLLGDDKENGDQGFSSPPPPPEATKPEVTKPEVTKPEATKPERIMQLVRWTWEDGDPFCPDAGSALDHRPAAGQLTDVPAGRAERVSYHPQLCGIAWEIRSATDEAIFVSVRGEQSGQALNISRRANGKTADTAFGIDLFIGPKRPKDARRFGFKIAAGTASIESADIMDLPPGIHEIDDGWVEIRYAELQLVR